MTICFFLLEKKTSFNKLSKVTKQVICGICFGLLAVLGTEWGIPINGAQVNTRDAAVLTSGLLFGPIAGIVAGLIGGIERYFAVYWGVGAYTRLACSISTTVAGFYGAVLRKYMFDDKRPSWTLAFAVGLVMEVFHMTMIFVTNSADTNKAMAVVESCSVIMIVANSLSFTLSSIVSKLLEEDQRENKNELPSISQTVQRLLLICVSIAFIATSAFVFQLQTATAETQATNYLSLAIEDVKSEIKDSADQHLLQITYEVADNLSNGTLEELCDKYDVAEINRVNREGLIVDSTARYNIGFDINSSDKTRVFNKLLTDEYEYVQELMQTANNDYVYRKYAAVRTNNGFIQVGIDPETYQKEITNEVKNATKNRHVGETGYVIIADFDRKVVSAPLGLKKESLDDYGFSNNLELNVLSSQKVAGQDCYCMYENAEGYSIISVIPKTESFKMRNAVVYANTFMEILVFAIMFGLIFMVIKKVIVNNLNKVNDSLDKITKGDLDEKVSVNQNYEFDSLSKDINSTVDTLKTYIQEAKDRIKDELKYAENIQMSSLPHTFPTDDRFEIYALMDPAKEVGGDFYDVFKISENKLSFLVADVSGKGIPGAMFMMRAKSVLRSFSENGQEVNDVFTNGNNSLCSGNDAGMFVTAWQGSIDLDTGLVNYACAGHNPPVIKHIDGTCEFVRGKAGFVLAGMEGVQYKLQQIQLEPGDILFLYTDGVTEATDPNKELYGEDRLIKALQNVDSNMDMEYLTCDVIGDVGRFVYPAEQFDDITMVALKYKGKKA